MMINITKTTAPPTDPPTMGPRRELELEELVAIGTPAEVVWDGAVVDVVDVDVRGRREIDEETGTGELVANAPGRWLQMMEQPWLLGKNSLQPQRRHHTSPAKED